MDILKRWLWKGFGQVDHKQIPGSEEDSVLATDLQAILREVNSPGQPSDMPRRIRLCRQALNLVDRRQVPDLWAALQGMLGSSLARNMRGERAENLEQAIQHFKSALEVRTRAEFPEQWAGIQNNLANAYADRIRGERAENLEQAIRHFGQALAVYTRADLPEQWALTQHDLAQAYADRIRGKRGENIRRAIHHFEQALEVHTCAELPAEHGRTQRDLGDLYFGQGEWAAAETAYAAAIAAEADLPVQTHTETGYHDAAGSRSQTYIGAAYCAIRLGRPAASLLHLEQGKTYLLRETLALSEVELAALPEAEREVIGAARQAVHDLEAEIHLPPDTPARRSDRALAKALAQARAALDQLVESIHAARPEFVPTGLDLVGLLDLIPAGGALVVPLLTSQGSAVFIVPHGTETVTQEHLVALDGFTTANLQTLLQGPPGGPQPAGWFGVYDKYRVSPDSPTIKQQWLDRLETVGQELWDGILGPVHERLLQQGLRQGAAVLFMPQGGLGLLPIHAAWHICNGRRRYLLDDWTIRYLPSGYALSVARQRQQEERRQGHRLLAVVDPTQDLRFAPAEGRAVTALFSDFQRLEGKAATVEAVIRTAPGCHYFHLACRGSYDWWDPMRSGLTLAAGQKLTLSELIAELDLSASRLVTLSACETGMTNIRRPPDEYLGLPAGLLQAGVPAVVGTLWPVDDLATGLLLERFYRNLLGHAGGRPLSADAALRAAQCWLRDVSAEELHEHSDTAAVALEQTPASATPFSHPYYWATFTCSGACDSS